jgi:hypothetical protein
MGTTNLKRANSEQLAQPQVAGGPGLDFETGETMNLDE